MSDEERFFFLHIKKRFFISRISPHLVKCALVSCATYQKRALNCRVYKLSYCILSWWFIYNFNGSHFFFFNSLTLEEREKNSPNRWAHDQRFDNMQTIIHLTVCICHMHIGKWTRSFIFQLRLIFFFVRSNMKWSSCHQKRVTKQTKKSQNQRKEFVSFSNEGEKEKHLPEDKWCKPNRLQFHGMNVSIMLLFPAPWNKWILWN